jgi:NTE family protein
MDTESLIKMNLDKILKPTSKKLPINIQIIDTLVLSGGGVKGLYYVGIIKKLEELNIIKNIKNFAGTSIGAFFACLLAIGFNSKELMEFLMLFNITRMKKANYNNFFSFFGIDNGNNLKIILEQMFELKGFNKNITFGEFYNKTQKNLIITGVCVNEKKCHYFNYLEYPKLEIIEAVRISTSIPLYFTPVQYNNKLWVDGGIIDNYPIDLFKDNLNKTLGIYLLEETKNSEINNLEEFLSCVLSSFSQGIAKKSIYGFENNTVIIKTNDIGIIDLNIDKEKIIQFINYGYDYLSAFFF